MTPKLSVVPITAIVVAVVICVFLSLNQVEESTDLLKETFEGVEVSSPQKQNDTQLSSDVSFPTPVIQLQQTIAHGLIEVETHSLPLLNGDLAEFSEKNINDEYPSSPELEDLKHRLKKLKSLSK